MPQFLGLSPSSANSSQGAKPQPPASWASRLKENPHFEQGQVANAQNPHLTLPCGRNRRTAVPPRGQAKASMRRKSSK